MILVDQTNEHNCYEGIKKLLRDNIPAYAIEFTSNNINLSQWFRKNMGRAFSFIDLDYLIYKPNDEVIIVEEKNSLAARIGYGQLLSLRELATDIFVGDTAILFVYVDGNTIQSYLCKKNEI